MYCDILLRVVGPVYKQIRKFAH